LAVAVGLFIGCLPLYGLHAVLCALICLPLGLDFVLAYLVANISNPFVAPFLITLEVLVGSWLFTHQPAGFSLARAKETGVLGFVWEAFAGSVVVGGTLAALGSAIAYGVARRGGTSAGDASFDDPLDAAVKRTIVRYARAPRGDRFNAIGKLHWDPLTKMLAELPHDLGRVVDAGAGRGQFGLLLKELGACQELYGFDSDPRKVQAATLAAAGQARFETRDLLDLPSEPCDTLLLFDVLHYLPEPEQDQLLRRASRITRTRIVLRELDAGHGTRSALTRLGEWLSECLGVHRGRAGRHYRPIADYRTLLTELGFSCELQAASQGTPFANVLLVATRSAPPTTRP
jgi:SAM-dependent methyltransferase